MQMKHFCIWNDQQQKKSNMEPPSFGGGKRVEKKQLRT